MEEEITLENFQTVDIKSLALNTERFGEITFNRSLPFLVFLQNTLKEFSELQYETALIPEFVERINSQRDRFIEKLRVLQSFRLAEGFNKDIRDNFENEVEALYQDVYREDLTWLTYLRQSSSIQSKDSKKLQEEQRAVTKIRAEYEAIIKQLEEKKSEYEKETTELEKAAGEKAAVTFGKHFENQARDYASKAAEWEAKRGVVYRTLLTLILLNIGAYLYLFITFKLNLKPHLDPADFFTLQYGVFKIAFLGLLSWSIGVASKAQNVNANLEALNCHKKNIAETIRDFTKSSASSEDKSLIMKIGAEAMFRHLPTGYSGKDKGSDDGPVEKIINNFISGKV